MATILAAASDNLAIGGVTVMCLGAFTAALRLMSSGTARIDASAQARVDALEDELERVERRHEEERRRWDAERADLLSRISRLEARAGIEDQ